MDVQKHFNFGSFIPVSAVTLAVIIFTWKKTETSATDCYKAKLLIFKWFLGGLCP